MSNFEIIDQLACHSASEFLDRLRLSQDLWRPDPAHWIFRGQARADWPLVPSALRHGVRLNYGSPSKIAPLTSRRDQIFAEFDLIRSFMLIADRQGLVLPEDGHLMRTPDGWREIIAPAIKSAIAGSGQWPPSQLLSVVGLAQHYGVPTRLLDWTEKPFVAAYFAAIEPATEAARFEVPAPQVEGELSVWALSQRYALERWNVTDVEVLIVTAPRATNPNLQAQAGLFTLHRSTVAESLDVVLRRAGEGDLLDDSPLAARLPLMRRLTLPRREARSLLRLLSYEGVDGASIFPGLAGVVASLRKKLVWDRGWEHPWGTMEEAHARAYFDCSG